MLFLTEQLFLYSMMRFLQNMIMYFTVQSNIQSLLDTMKTYGVFAKQLITNEILPAPKDLVFYEVVMAKQDENAYLVTGNSKHFPKKPFIVTPNELLDIMK